MSEYARSKPGRDVLYLCRTPYEIHDGIQMVLQFCPDNTYAILGYGRQGKQMWSGSRCPYPELVGFEVIQNSRPYFRWRLAVPPNELSFSMAFSVAEVVQILEVIECEAKTILESENETGLKLEEDIIEKEDYWSNNPMRIWPPDDSA